MKKANGFTLIELTMSLVLMGLMAVTIASYTASPFAAYVTSTNRAELVNLADTALNSIARDLRTALPNSVRVSGSALEFLPVSYGGRYRAASSGVAGSDPLDFTSPDSSFQTFGTASGWPAGARMVVYHTGQTGANAWAGDNVITPASTSFTLTAGAGETLVTLSAAQKFPFASPQKRFYLITQPVSFLCDSVSGQLNRYSAYAIQPVQPTNAGVAPLSAAASQRVVDYVSACSFSYTPGSAQHSGMVTIDLTLTENGESVHLLQQVHVNNGA